MTEGKMDYPYIRAWHYTTNSNSSYVEDLLHMARRTKAPADTCFFTFTDRAPVTRASILEKDPNNEAIRRCDKWLQARNA